MAPHDEVNPGCAEKFRVIESRNWMTPATLITLFTLMVGAIGAFFELRARITIQETMLKIIQNDISDIKANKLTKVKND